LARNFIPSSTALVSADTAFGTAPDDQIDSLAAAASCTSVVVVVGATVVDVLVESAGSVVDAVPVEPVAAVLVVEEPITSPVTGSTGGAVVVVVAGGAVVVVVAGGAVVVVVAGGAVVVVDAVVVLVVWLTRVR
jgi:hypothetical protein